MPRRINPFNPFDYVDLALQQQKLALSATETIWRRSALYSRGALTPLEATAMWMEKPAAFAKGAEKAMMAAARGKSPAKIMDAALDPLTRKASSNAKRLRG